MLKPPPYTITHESIVVVWEGKPHTVQKGSPNFLGLRTAINDEKWEDIPKHLTVPFSLTTWAKGRFSVNGNTISYDGTVLPSELNSRILAMATGGEDPTRFFKFWERLQRNPSYRSVQQLWGFLEHAGIPLTPDGCFLAYKGVTSEYKDHHTKTVDNTPGVVNEMPRNKISDDPAEACHPGFHVGALHYAQTTWSGGRVIVCKVDPEHVVCVPNDFNQQKMRVCKYRVLGNHGSQLPSTSYEDELDTNAEPEVIPAAAPIEEAVVEPTSGVKKRKRGKKEAKVEEPAPEPVKKPKVPKEYARFTQLSAEELVLESIEDLRKYAGHGLKIVGASKIPGGKVTLVGRIIEVRS